MFRPNPALLDLAKKKDQNPQGQNTNTNEQEKTTDNTPTSPAPFVRRPFPVGK